jgi:hypothetical protein
MRMIIIYFSRLYKLDEQGSHFENLKNFIKFLNENDYRLHFVKVCEVCKVPRHCEVWEIRQLRIIIIMRMILIYKVSGGQEHHGWLPLYI